MASSLDNLTQLLGISQAIKGKSATTTANKSGTTSTQANITDEGMQRLIDQILAGQGGIKDISGGARAAGLYNSTTEQQLTNDLVARTAGELAARQAGTTTTTDETTVAETKEPGVSLGGILGPMAALSAGKSLLGGILGLGKQAPATSAGSIGSGLLGGTLGTGSIANPAFAAGLNGNTLGSFLGGGSGSDLLGNIVAGPALGDSLGTSIGGVGAPAFSSAGDFGLSSIPGAGSFLSGLLGGGDPSEMSGFGLASSALAGLATMGPVGLLMAPVMNMLGSGLGGISIVCTALKNRGLLDRELYEAGREYLEAMDWRTRNGYIALFSGVARKIEAGNKFWTAVCLPFARGRTSLLASKSKWKYLKHPIGSLTKFVGEPLCKAYYNLVMADSKPTVRG